MEPWSPDLDVWGEPVISGLEASALWGCWFPDNTSSGTTAPAGHDKPTT